MCVYTYKISCTHAQVESVRDELFETNFELQGCNKRLKLATDENEELDAKLNEALQDSQVLCVCLYVCIRIYVIRSGDDSVLDASLNELCVFAYMHVCISMCVRVEVLLDASLN
jgi:hypothetical protein